MAANAATSSRYAKRLLLLALFAAAVTNGAIGSPLGAAEVDVDVESDGVGSVRARRSLCNTFGGCGSNVKRSIQPDQQSNYIAGAASGVMERRVPLAPTAFAGANGGRSGDSSAGLIAEILGELLEYLEANEKYKNGKYIVMVPRSYDASMSPPIMTLDMQSGNPVDLHELQLNRLYLGKGDRS